MNIEGKLTEDEFVEFVSMKLKLDIIENTIKSNEFNEQAKLLIIRGLMAEQEGKS